MDACYGILPDRFYTEAELDALAEDGVPIPRSRSQRDRMRKIGMWPMPAKVTPGRNSTLGLHIIDVIERRLCDALAKLRRGAMQRPPNNDDWQSIASVAAPVIARILSRVSTTRTGEKSHGRSDLERPCKFKVHERRRRVR
jgi:hypothetical protein